LSQLSLSFRVLSVLGGEHKAVRRRVFVLWR